MHIASASEPIANPLNQLRLFKIFGLAIILIPLWFGIIVQKDDLKESKYEHVIRLCQLR